MNRLLKTFGWGAMLAALAASAGCQAPATRQQTAQANAEQRWKTARADVKFRLAEEQFQRGQVEAAEVELGAARQLDPESPALKIAHARVLLSRGQTSAAEALLREVAATGFDAGEVEYLLGTAAQQRLAWDRADRHYRSALRHRPDEIAYLSAAVQALLQKGAVEDAGRLLDECRGDMEWQPGYQAALAEQLEAAADWSAAASAWRRAVGDRTDTDLRERKAIALFRAGQWSVAADELAQLIAADSARDSGVLARMRIECLLNLRRFELAEREAQQRVHAVSDDLQARLLLARAAAGQGQFERAWRLAEEVRRASPNDPEMVLVAAALGLRCDRPQQAEALLARWPSNTLDPSLADDLRRALAARDSR